MLRFISWNVNGLRACVGKDFENQFKALDADFFCLQETKMQEGQLDLTFEGYESYWNYAEKKGYSGTAIYTKHKPLSVSYGMGVEEHDHEGRIITLEYEQFYLVTCYTPNSQTEFREGLDELAGHYKEVLKLLGEDPEREGLAKTPMRVAKAMQILTRGYTQDAHKVLTDALFDEKYNQMVIVKDIDFFSMCEHHILPFYGKVHVAYIPNGKITGLSKIARVVDIYSHRLQVQERLTQQIKDCIQETLNPQGVMVVIEAKHMCMQMRGVEKQNSITTTSDYSGVFNSLNTRQEFMSLLRGETKRI